LLIAEHCLSKVTLHIVFSKRYFEKMKYKNTLFFKIKKKN